VICAGLMNLEPIDRLRSVEKLNQMNCVNQAAAVNQMSCVNRVAAVNQMSCVKHLSELGCCRSLWYI